MKLCILAPSIIFPSPFKKYFITNENHVFTYIVMHMLVVASCANHLMLSSLHNVLAIAYLMAIAI